VESNLNLTSATGKALLFDMDGTLTEARRKISQPIVHMLKELCDMGHSIAVVSGSPYYYIEEQLELSRIQYPKKLYIMPCNGTQVYTQRDSSREYEQTYKVTMRDHMASHSSLSDPHRLLVQNILDLQMYAMRKYDFPVTGNFISDRGSMINWSPIGRDASHEVRATFILEDNDKSLRKHLCDCLRVRLDDSDLRTTDLALGGSTSIDIFPKGWDKTYALNHLEDDTESWFWGDKCMPEGNDYALWLALQSSHRSFSVETPEDTLESINTLISQGRL
jgi:phosphomannomutase